MPLGIYKPGQGYWMRVVTASMLGVLTLATAMWVASEAKGITGRIGHSSYSMTLTTLTGTPPGPGARVTLLGRASSTTPEPPVIGSADVVSFDAQNKTIVLGGVQITDDKSAVSDVRLLRVGDAGAPAFQADGRDAPRGQTAIEPLYVQGGAAILVLIIGSILTYFLVGHKPASVEFLIATDMEMKKVNWSTRRDITGSTWVVIGASFIIAAFLFVFDLALKSFFQLIGVLVG
jgi:preprotein translocase SecE subunit